MKSLITHLIIISWWLVSLCAPIDALALEIIFPGPTASQQPEFWDQFPEAIKNQQGVYIDLLALLTAYGAFCKGVALERDGKLYLIMRNGTRILYDDGKVKSFEEKLNHPDLEDMLSQPYTSGAPHHKFLPNYDPGRFREEAFFKALYGATTAAVKVNMSTVRFVDTTVGFNSHNGAAAALERVGERLRRLVRQDPGLRVYIFPLGGIFNWRTISGTKRSSPHSWGIAIDLNPKYGHYWRWNRSLDEKDIIRIQRVYPLEIVKSFEEEGFIWGGKWSHFDTMHFEYRPELLLKAQIVEKLSKGQSLREIIISLKKGFNN